MDIGAFEVSVAVYTVTNTYDGGTGSLRNAITQANQNQSTYGSLIQFDPTVFNTPQTIALSSSLILSETNGPEVIDGPTAGVTVSGGGPSSNFSVFTVNSGVTASISGLTISNGNADFGGGVYNSGSLTLTNDTLSGNSAQYGGGVFTCGTAALTNDTISGNSAQDFGGGVFNDFGTATLTNDTLSGNSAQYGSGGGVYNDYGTATLTNDTLSGNSAGRGGGVFNDYSGTATFTNDTLSGNSAQYGGGVYNFYGTATLTNDTLSGNSAQYGGGVFNDYSGTATFTNDTLSGNSAQYGGGVYNDYSGTATLINTIVANSTSGGDISGSVTGNNNLIDDASTAGGFTNGVNGNIVGVSPLLAPLGNYGGPTQTMALLPGSPAIAAGDTSLAVDAQGHLLTTDQRGMPRMVDGAVDIGAFESSGFTLAVAAGNNQSADVNTAFPNPLQVTVTPNNPGDPVDGGVVTFTLPASGASATLSPSGPVTIASGTASVTATANGTSRRLHRDRDGQTASRPGPRSAWRTSVWW